MYVCMYKITLCLIKNMLMTRLSKAVFCVQHPAGPGAEAPAEAAPGLAVPVRGARPARQHPARGTAPAQRPTAHQGTHQATLVHTT
jgi:hypothetical protein